VPRTKCYAPTCTTINIITTIINIIIIGDTIQARARKKVVHLSQHTHAFLIMRGSKKQEARSKKQEARTRTMMRFGKDGQEEGR
jgi:hypothetical protein